MVVLKTIGKIPEYQGHLINYTMSIPPQTIKTANLALGSLAILTSLLDMTEIFGSFAVFLRGLFALAASIPILYLEFRKLPQLYKFASFYYSFLGRGVLFMLLSCNIANHGVFNLLVSLLLFLSGVIFTIFHFSPFIDEPENFKTSNSGLTVGDDEFDDDDEVI